MNFCLFTLFLKKSILNSSKFRPHVGDSSFIVIFNLKTAMRHAVIIWLFSIFFYFSFFLYVLNHLISYLCI